MDPELTTLMSDLDYFTDCFNLAKNDLGKTLLDLTALAILAYMVDEKDPDGRPWENLSHIYLLWKDHVAPGAPIGVLYGHMRRLDQLNGERLITADAAQVEYGVDIQAKMEADKFQWGGLITGSNQPPREFFAINALAESWADLTLDGVFNAIQ